MPMQDWLRSGRPRIGLMTAIADPMVADIIGRAGFDWVWADGEHGQIDARAAALHAALYRGRLKTLVRVPDKSRATLGRFLDAGVDGLIVPQLESAAELAEVLDGCFYPPRGLRGVGGVPANGYGADLAGYIADPPYAIFAQVETAGALAEVEAFAADPRLGGILIGPFDLSGALGQLGNIGHPDVVAAIAHILATCRRFGTPCGIFCLDPASARAYAAQGFDLVCMGVDVGALLGALGDMLAAYHA